ncbi:MAG: AI-2E family transporter [Campylobacterota bacterium]|nr:AI-2E family transporter [Campylobacterota bacterium]
MSKTYMVIVILFSLALMGAYTIYKPFLLSMIVAMLLTMATYNLTKKMTRKLNSRKLSALLMTIFLTAIIFAPIIYVTTVGVEYFTQLDKQTLREMIHSAQKTVENIPYIGEWAGDSLKEEKILSYIQESAYYLTSLGSAGIGFVKNMLLVILFYFIINLYGDRIFELIRSLLPVSRIKSTKMIHEVSSTMEVVFYSTIATASLEGLLFGIFIASFGFNGLLLGIIYGFASLIPVIGGALVWVPVALYSWSKIDVHTAWVIVLYSVIVVSIIADTFVKPVIIKVIKEDMLKRSSDINELVIFFSILAGMSSYGVWGMILGPAITSFLIAMTRVYIEYNRDNSTLQ